MAVRSSLEEMLESLQMRDDKPTDLPPALPSRPSSKANRLPSSRNSLPVNFKVGDENGGIGGFDGKEEILRSSRGSFGRRKKTKVEQHGESPYAGMVGEKRRDDLWMNRRVSDLRSVPSTRCHEIECEDDIEYFIKKVIKGLKGDLFPANPDILDGADDPMQLNFLNEPSLLHYLRCRYSNDSIYCKAGPLMISLNPFKNMQLYENDAVTAYRHKFVDTPHVYATVNAAYSDMMRDGRNQSIILSGENGAGKTETAKCAVKYLTSLSGSNTELEAKIMLSCNILEAFGNAQTLSNNNASLYSKLTEIHFTPDGKISCSRLQTFFLEKSRVVQLANGERSFHIFYQLCAGATSSLKAKLNLKAANFYKYLNRSDSRRIDEVDDERKFHTLLEAMDTAQICKDYQEHVFAMVAAVLWFGNISFKDGNSDQVEVVMDEAVSTVSRLLRCSTQDLITALSSQADSCSKLTFQEATASRDAFASYLYASLLEWLVEELNKSFEASKGYSGNTISILDMFGFGTSPKNSFEQICINYANERLQEHYNRHLFKLVQEDLELEGIDYNKIDFQDNQDCLGLFEKCPRGFFSLLDEESILAKTSDMTFAHRLKQHLSGNPCYKSDQGGKFTIRHYFRSVTYDVDGFLTKNKDSLPQNLIQLLDSCSCSLPQLFASELLQQHDSENPSLGDCLNRSVGTMFKGQIFTLIQQLESSQAHFILCIRPNSKQLPEMFEKELVSKQLRCYKIVEALRMHRYGYITRMTHQEFVTRFRILLGDADTVSLDPLSASTAILQQYQIHPTSYQVGYTKLFFRPEQIDQLEGLKNKVLEGAFKVQKLFPIPCTCRNLEAMKTGVITPQSFIRGENTRREYEFIRKLSSKVLLSLRALQGNQKTTVIQLQSAIRGGLARQMFNHMRSAKRLSSEMGDSLKKIDTKTPEGLSQENAAVSPSVMQDIRVQLVMAEATLGQKEEENAALRQQLQQLQSKWSGHEAKMKTMEDAWQLQMTSLQASLTAAKKSIATDNPSTEPRRFMMSPSPLSDSEDTMSMGNQTGGSPLPYGSVADGHAGRETNGKAAPISHLVNESDQKKHIFDEEAKPLGSDSHRNPEQQLRQLKLWFAQWKKDYKVRLREAKVKLSKQGHPDMERSHRKWWGKKHRKASS